MSINYSKMQVKSLFQPSLLDMSLDVADFVFEKMEPKDFEVFSFGGRLNCGGFSLDPGACTQRFRSPRW
eukprot:NP_508346.3 Uncharacterized protein CELE_B0294.3 [Caenorhabditis elegans]